MFCECESLRNIKLPSTLERIRDYCFAKSGLEKVEIPDRVVEIAHGAFGMCESLESVTFGEKSELEVVGPEAFARSKLRAFVAPPPVRTIARGAFSKCTELKRVELNEGLEALGEDEYPEDGKRYYGVFEDSALKEIVLPSTLRRIEYNTFSCCKNLTKLVLPDLLCRIGDSCLQKSGIQEITIPDQVEEI